MHHLDEIRKPRPSPFSAPSIDDDETMAKVAQIADGIAFPMTMQAAIELGLLDIISTAGPGAQLTAAEVAAKLQTTNPQAARLVDRMLRLLAAFSVVSCSFVGGERRRVYGLTAVSSYFVKGEDGVSMAPLLLLHQDNVMLQSWLVGATMLAPVVNYGWKGFPAALSAMAFKKQLQQDQWALRVAHYMPWLTYWWNTQRLFPSSSAIARSPRTLSTQDKQLMAQRQSSKTNMIGLDEVSQQGEYELFHRSLMVGFGSWEFDPMELVNPFEDREGTVHIWQGDDDQIVPVELQRYIAQKLDWIKLHEVSGAGHMFTFANGMCEAIVKAQLLGN